MHEWAAVNTWPRPVTNGLNGRYSRHSLNIPIKQDINGRYSVNIPMSAAKIPKSGLSRCRTNLFGPSSVFEKQQVYKPRLKFRESSTLDYIQQLKVNNKEAEAKIHSTVHMLGVQRSRSDVDTRDAPISQISGAGVTGGGLLKERTQVYMTSSTDFLRHEGPQIGNRQEMKVSMAVVPRKGLISLSTGETEHPGFHGGLSHITGESRRMSTRDHEQGRSRPKTLIKRKDIMDHYKAGFRVLEDEEIHKQQEEELEKSLENYTIMDLQSGILEMTDTRALHRPSPFLETTTRVPASRRVPPPQPVSQKNVVLPAIRNFNPFIVNS